LENEHSSTLLLEHTNVCTSFVTTLPSKMSTARLPFVFGGNVLTWAQGVVVIPMALWQTRLSPLS
jgi:hypothetical protein